MRQDRRMQRSLLDTQKEQRALQPSCCLPPTRSLHPHPPTPHRRHHAPSPPPPHTVGAHHHLKAYLVPGSRSPTSASKPPVATSSSCQAGSGWLGMSGRYCSSQKKFSGSCREAREGKQGGGMEEVPGAAGVASLAEQWRNAMPGVGLQRSGWSGAAPQRSTAQRSTAQQRSAPRRSQSRRGGSACRGPR